jgi:hypothetical protein
LTVIPVIQGTADPGQSGPPFVGRKKTQGLPPHLPDGLVITSRGLRLQAQYRLCLDEQGSVTTVRPEVPIAGAHGSIVKALKSWRFTSGAADCSVVKLDYQIN